uniref:NADH dehydrogenase subunit 2 n=1 Tax=Nematodirus oiratianus TaxID=94037 RepID=A0A075CGB7_NEMOI|nr:NADH dehydrogenase subunit 2 [Nematodirus oiratianus]AGZ64207.1 NADH dehydrogenase subunit 2 [Nematodirus oiratianus]
MFFIIMVMMFSFIVMLVNNVVVWWSVFLLMTLLFVSLNKGLMSYSSLFNYFVLQESLGLLFLLLSFGFLQFILLLLKIGVSPLHFWIFSVLDGVYGFNLVWFLTFQKMPFLFVMMQFVYNVFVWVFVVGLLVCLLQMLLVKSLKNLLVLSSTESFNWMFLSFVFSFLSVFFLFLYYLVLMVMLIPKFEFLSVYNFVGWETALVFMNMPFSVNFFIKIYSLVSLLNMYSFFILLILMMLFLSVLSVSFWLINLSVKLYYDYKYSKSLYPYLMLMMLVVIM